MFTINIFISANPRGEHWGEMGLANQYKKVSSTIFDLDWSHHVFVCCNSDRN